MGYLAKYIVDIATMGCKLARRCFKSNERYTLDSFMALPLPPKPREICWEADIGVNYIRLCLWGARVKTNRTITGS